MNLSPYYKRAEEHINSASTSSLRYACLELRMCLEELAYRELRIYLSAFPGGIDDWQPRRVIEALKQLDETVASDYDLVITPHQVDGPVGQSVVVGQHKGIATQLIKKHYNKLGYYLHSPTPAKIKSDLESLSTLPEYLQKVLGKLRALDSSARAADTSTVEFVCQKCGDPVIANVRYAKAFGLAFCTKENCGAQYEVIERDGQFRAQLKIFKFDCPNCKASNTVEHHFLTPEYTANCQDCGQLIGFRQEWRPFLENSD